jgi:hypothetical protein
MLDACDAEAGVKVLIVRLVHTEAGTVTAGLFVSRIVSLRPRIWAQARRRAAHLGAVACDIFVGMLARLSARLATGQCSSQPRHAASASTDRRAALLIGRI